MSVGGFSTSNYASVASTPVTAAPLTLACFANISSVAAIGDLVCIGATGSTHKFRLSYNTSAQIAAGAQDAGSSSSQTGTSFSLSTTFHAGATFSSSTARTAFLNGAAGVTNTVARTPASVARIGVGIRSDNTLPSSPATGWIAEVGIWAIDLNADEMLALANGISPLLIRPAYLRVYYPLVRRAALINRLDSYSLTETGTLTDYDHVRVTRPGLVFPCKPRRIGARAYHHRRRRAA